MTRNALTLFAAALLIAPLAALGQSEGEGEVAVGVRDASVSDSPDAAAEYDNVDSGPRIGLIAAHRGAEGAVEVEIDFRDSNEQSHALRFDIERFVRSTTTYTGFEHRLGADPLENLESVTAHGRVVRHELRDPLREYGLDYSELRHRTEIQPPSASNLTFGFELRQQERDGMLQHLTVSHCDNCHVVSQNRPLDERTRDLGFDVRFATGSGEVKASYNRRTLDQGAGALTMLYDDALHPELRAPVFDNRLQFDSAEGPQVVGRRPEITKDTGKLSARFGDVGGFALGATGIVSTTENESAGLESTYRGANFAAARPFANGTRFSWRGRIYSLSSDDVFVDAVERLGIAGPQAGKTYRQIYGFDPDYLRRSSLDRDVIASNLEVERKLAGRAGRLRFTWAFESVDRDAYEVAPGETETTTNVLGLDWTVRPRKGTRFQARYRHGFVDQPFSLVDGASSTLVSSSSPNPFLPQAAQYYVFHDARVRDTSATASDWDELWLRGSWTSASGTTLSASWKAWDGSNDDGDLADWSKSSQSATLMVAGVAAPEMTWHGAVVRHDQTIEMPTSIPIFDG